MSINLSDKSLGDPAMSHLIENQIKNLQIDPSRIIFELTETATFQNPCDVRNFMQRIGGLGCRFALDNFGFGISGFCYLKELNFEYLKLSGDFVKQLPQHPRNQAFIRAMVEISKVFGLRVIAEWVEDEETATMLREFDVEFGQGNFFGKPGPL